MQNDYLDYISHHGIEGQKWGVQNGPPYPLNPAKDYSKAEKIANKITKKISSTENKIERRNNKSNKIKNKAEGYKVKRDKNIYGLLGSQDKAQKFDYKYKKELAKANNLKYKNDRDMQRTISYVEKMSKRMIAEDETMKLSSSDEARVNAFIKTVTDNKKMSDLAYEIHSI